MALFHLATAICAVVHFISFPKSSVATDTLSPDQTLSLGHTLISQNQIFELGFFTPGKSTNRFLGIWYKSTPDVCVWVANRNSPIAGSENNVFLTLAGNGTLLISQAGNIIWSPNPSAVASNPLLQLLNTGNLVLLEASSRSHIWQSFDHPTDTRLPGMKLVDDGDKYLTSWRNPEDPSPGEYIYRIETHGLSEMVVYRGKVKTFRTGKWNGLYFSGVLPFPNHVFNPELVFVQQRLISVVEPYDSSVFTRVTLDTSGVIQRLTMNSRKDKWNPVVSAPLDPCDEYGQCGPNGFCRIDKPIRCECFKGFSPKFSKEWDHQDWSGGCTIDKPLSCEGGDGFLEVKKVKYPDMLSFQLNTSMGLGDCRSECLRNCNCTAYASPYLDNGGYGCLMWFGDLIDVREYPPADAKQNIYIRLRASEVDYGSSWEQVRKEKDKEKEKAMPTKIILISMAFGVFVSWFINGGILLMARIKGQVGNKNENELELPLFKLETIITATNNFSIENKVGEGGFGPVYMGNLSREEKIAVKRLSNTSSQGLEEFKNEVILIAKLQHKNLVRLLGCCIERDERMLIYEYLQNRSLDYFIFDWNRRKLLTWPKRFDIIIGIARGLLYLHHDSRLKVIHRDLKTSNILLDGSFSSKISDFGIARSFGEDQLLAKTKRVVGTYGYMAPEYAFDGKFSVKSDVFSLGVVLLEIVSGKKNRAIDGDHYYSLLGHAWLLWKEDRSLELMDESLNDTCIETEVKRCIQVGLLCVQKFAEDRPTMSSVIFMLSTDGTILPEPNEPGFFIHPSSSPVRNCTPPCAISTRMTMTITDLEAR
ncbi:G-type lectin S-receptor-like serine/threonine-protein kinase [Striga hermonthica]|uniref:Receptor-like serine/threonine-protein kinase n=1 Tax=Striga hermonthica TaxID=68872 RepID=A0A9N7RSX2_STRHE|nr:G-type lectin S-receptor-like serine/threonine-protein kinase [Striga hermonthica]